MPKIEYHEKEKILSIRLSEEQSVDSDAQNNVVLDYDKNGQVVNVDIMSVSLDEFSQAKEYFDGVVRDK